MPKGPEWFGARDWRRFLKPKGWECFTTHGNRFQSGFPDDYLIHKEFGTRWVDYKYSKKNVFTQAQRKLWPLWDALGVGIWILTEVVSDTEFQKLFGPPNWRDYWKPSYGEIDIDALLEEVR